MRINGSTWGAKSSRTRTRVAAAQAVLSVVLLLVVYLTLLRPDSEGELLAVKAEQGSEFRAEGSFPPSGGEREGEVSQGDVPLEPVAPAGEPAPGSLDQPAPESLGAPQDDPLEPDSSAPPVDDGDGDSPTDDQYGDAVARLLGGVGAPD